MGMLTRNKDPAGQPANAPAPAPQPKPGRFANLRAKLARPNEHADVSQLDDVVYR